MPLIGLPVCLGYRGRVTVNSATMCLLQATYAHDHQPLASATHCNKKPLKEM